MRFLSARAAACLCLALPGAAQAAGWAPAKCGSAPDAPTLHLGTVEQYNASVDAFNAYAKTARAYNDCLVREVAAAQAANNAEAVRQNQAISASARSIQAGITANFTRDSAALKAAGAKLKK